VNRDLALALSLAERAAVIARAESAGSTARHKADGSPVTELDVALEQRIVAELAIHRPGDSVLGEECGAHPGDTGRQWILDPIDGTAELLRGGMGWGTHIALSEHGRITVAVVTRPLARRRWWAAAGHGCWTDGRAGPRRLRVSTVAALAEARIGGLLEPGSGYLDAVRGRATWAEDELSIVGAFLEGRVDAVLDDAGDCWDLAPASLLTTEAGGRFTDLAGGQRIDLGGAVYSNGVLHGELDRLLSAGQRKE
jgi:histidinol-phosphatase